MRQEILAGIAMGFTLVPGLVAASTLLEKTGMDFAGAYTACVLSSVLAALLLGAFCRQPITAAPGVALAGWLAYVVVLSHGHSWQSVLGASFLASCFCLGAVWCLRKRHGHEFLPRHLSESLTCGLALMLILLGLRQGHVLVSSPVGFFAMGDWADPVAFHSILGLMLTAVLLICRLPGAIFFGMILTGLISLMEGFWIIPAAPFMLPDMGKTALQLDIPGALELPEIILSLVILEWVLLQGICTALRQTVKGKTAAAFFSASAAGALMGTFPLVPAPESAVGTVSARSGGTSALAAAGVLALVLCCEPLAAEIASYGAITAPALVLSGCLLLRQAGFPQASGLSEFLSACSICVLLPLTQSVAAAFGTGTVMYVFLALWEGRRREITAVVWCLAASFCILFYLVS